MSDCDAVRAARMRYEAAAGVMWANLGRMAGKMAEMEQQIADAVARGDHVDVATAGGLLCAGNGGTECTLPPWKPRVLSGRSR